MTGLAPSVSVVIPTYQRQTILCDTLRSVLAQSWPNLEIIVVDQTQGMASALGDLLAQYPDRICYVTQAAPNLPRARNAGAALSTGDTIVFIDDDVVLPPNFVQCHVARLFADSRTGAVTGPVVSSLSDDVDAMMPGCRTAFGVRPDGADLSFPATWLMGCNFSVKRSALTLTGPFDETFTGSAYCEDVDMGVRIRRSGLQIVFDRDAWLVHLALPTGGCETRNAHDGDRRERERLQHLLYCRLKHASFEGRGKTAVLLYRAYRAFVGNSSLRTQRLRSSITRVGVAIAETWHAYRRTQALRVSHPSSV